jgi:hypothetical protein
MGTEGGSEPTDGQPTADAQPTGDGQPTTSTQPIDETRPNAMWVVPALMAVGFFLAAVTGRPETDALGTAFFLAFGVFMVGIAIVLRRSWFRLFTDRMEYSSPSGKARVMWFRDVEEAVLREGAFGGAPVLRVRSVTGQELSWNAAPRKGDPGVVTEKRIKAVSEALVAYGVEVDSQNYMRTGPFRMWRV